MEYVRGDRGESEANGEEGMTGGGVRPGGVGVVGRGGVIWAVVAARSRLIMGTAKDQAPEKNREEREDAASDLDGRE